MEPFIANFLTNNKMPKPLRYIVLAAVICFVEWVLLSIAAVADFVIIKVVLFALAALMLPVGVRLAMKIRHSVSEEE